MIIHWWSRNGTWVIVDGRSGDTGRGWADISSLQQKRKNHPQVWNFMLCLYLFQSTKRYLCGIITDTKSLCVQFSVVVYRSSCVYPWGCCLFIIRPPYCEDAVSVFTVSTTQSLSRRRHTVPVWFFCTRNNKFDQKNPNKHYVWTFWPCDASSMPFSL